MSGAVQRRGQPNQAAHHVSQRGAPYFAEWKGAVPMCRDAASPRPTFVGAHSMRPRAADSRPYGMRVSWEGRSRSGIPHEGGRK